MWWWLSAEPRPLPGFWCFGLVGTFLGGERVGFVQPTKVHKWGWEWIKHADWMPFRAEKMTDVDMAAKKRRYSAGEVTQADKARSRTRVNLSLAFGHWRRGWGWRATQSWPAFCYQTQAVSLCKLAKVSTFPLKETEYSVIACCVCTSSIRTRYDTLGGIELSLNVVFSSCNKKCCWLYL